MTARFLTGLLAVAASAFSASGQQPDSPPSSGEFSVRSWRVPPGFFPASSNAPSSAGKTEPAQQSPQAYLEASGVIFPEGSFARYNPKANKVVIRNTRENLELVDFLIGGGLICIFPNSAVDITALDCPTPISSKAANTPWPTLEDIRNLPAGEIKVLSQVSVLVKSGMRISTRQTSFANAKGKLSGSENGNFQPGEFGSKFEVEAVVGPDGLTVDLSYGYQLRRPLSNGTWAELELSGAMVVKENSPRIIHVSPLETKGRSLVLIADVRMLDFDGTETPPSWEQSTP